MGSRGSRDRWANRIRIPPAGKAYVAGWTTVSDFPTTTGAYDRTIGTSDTDVFVLKLNAAGTALVYSTFLGGRSGIDYATGIAIDSTGDAYITGRTSGSDFPTSSTAYQQGSASGGSFIAELGPAGSTLIYSTYLINATTRGIAVDSGGNAIVAGDAAASFLTTSGSLQPSSANPSGRSAFVFKLNPSGSAVTVGVPNVPPSVSLASPANGMTYGPSPTITLMANATDSDGTIASVGFFADGVPVGTAAVAPYTAIWSGGSSGTHTLTALATDNRGASTTSAPVSITINPNAPPSVTLSSPAAGATYYAPARIDLSAIATDGDGTISRVQFFLGSTSVGVVTAMPYAVTATGVAAGSYSVTATAMDNLGAQASSAPVNITVLPNNPPTASITEPTSGSKYFAPATVRVLAAAADSDGSILRVEFYAGSTLIGTATAAPYSVVWDNVAGGTYAVTAVAVDNVGGATTSAAVTITVVAGPSLTILEPDIDPKYGVASGLGSVYVRGTSNAPPNSSVVVNGQLAVVDDSGGFHVNNVPLSGTTSTITATVTTQDGVSSSQSITVVNGGAAPFIVVPDSNWGLKQKQITFTVRDYGTAPIQRFDFDFNSDGVVDYTAHPADFTNGQLQLALTYPQPGVYIGTVTAYDAQNRPIYTAKHAIIINDPVLLSTMLQGVFNQMLDRLRARNVDGALTAINGTLQDKYRDTFSALVSTNPDALNQLGTLMDGEVSENFTEFALERADPSGDTAVYLISIGRGEDGVWRIESM